MDDFKKQSITDYYNLRAAEYEQIYYREVPERRKEIDDEVIRLQKLVAGKNVLELACGTGYWTTRMSETAGTVIASDISSEMIAEARNKEFHCPTSFVRANLYNLPFDQESFDIVVLGFWFSHEPIQNYDTFLDSIRQLVKPGGMIWMIDNNPPAEGSMFQSKGLDEFGNNYKQRFLDDGTEFVILKNYFTSESLKSIFEPAFAIQSLIFKKYYWSVVLKPKI